MDVFTSYYLLVNAILGRSGEGGEGGKGSGE